MNVLLISYSNIEYDGRLRELLEISKLIGNVKCIVQGNPYDSKISYEHIKFKSNKFLNYIKFIFFCIKSMKNSEIDILFIDNRKAIIPAYILKKIKKIPYVVQDVRELYIMSETKHLAGKMGCLIETHFNRKSDVLISANNYRAEIMKKMYNLDSMPLVFDNIRELKYSEDFDLNLVKKKYSKLLLNNSFKIISTSGCSLSRTNDRLVRSMRELGVDFELLLVGKSSKNDVIEINKIINENKLLNVHIIDQVSQNELKYLINCSNLGIVNYNQNDTNNLYCASGKLYEFILDELPVVTTENPPLIDICNLFNIGLADNNYTNAIKEIASKYTYYKSNVINYKQMTNIDSTRENFSKKIIEKIHSSL